MKIIYRNNESGLYETRKQFKYYSGMIYLLLPCLILIAGLSGTTTLLGQTIPDPRLLLKGMISSREQIPPSRLWIRQVYSEITFHSDTSYLVEFDGDRRRFTPLTNQGNEVVQGKIQYDGKEIAIYRDDDVTFSDLNNSQGYFVFDPRILGVNAGYRALDRVDWFDTPDFKEWVVTLIGAETIDGRNAWHVCMVAPHCKFNWWIDEKNNFRVYRYVEDMGSGGRYEVNSSYNESYTWLPTNALLKVYNPQGNVVEERSVTVLKAEANVNFPDNAWTLAGMKIPTNEITVSDLRIKKVVGYWNGNRIRPYGEPAPHKPFKPVPVPLSPRRTFAMGVMCVLFIGPFIWLIVNRLKRKQKNE